MTAENLGEGATNSAFPWTDAQVGAALRGIAISGEKDIATLKKVVDRLGADIQAGKPELVQQLGATLVTHVRALGEITRAYGTLADQYGIENQFYAPPQEPVAETMTLHLE